jgi:hypothetical protein
VDGFRVGKIIREQHPAEWDILTSTKVNFWDVGTNDYGEFHKVTSFPTFM